MFSGPAMDVAVLGLERIRSHQRPPVGPDSRMGDFSELLPPIASREAPEQGTTTSYGELLEETPFFRQHDSAHPHLATRR